MTDLVEFLKARLDEDEQVALAASGAPWEAEPEIPKWIHVQARAVAENKLRWGHLGYVATVEREGDRQHIARHDPARVLREVEAKRRMLALHDREHHQCVAEDGPTQWHAKDPCATIRLLALPYADHEDFREEWRV